MLIDHDNTSLFNPKYFVPSKEQIERFELAILNMPQIEIETRHYFINGLYAREVLIPAGTILTGKIHKAEHLNIVSAGKIIVWTEDGMAEVQAPFAMISRPDVKRVGMALEDTVWTTIHATKIVATEITPDVLAALEVELIKPSVAIIEEKGRLCLG